MTKVNVLDKGFIKLVDVMGSDKSIVNSARISFNKQVSEIGPKDEKLIKYLWEHKHTSPFRHATLQFHIKAPLFVLRQWMKHQVGCVSGDTEIKFERTAKNGSKNGTYTKTIEELYYLWHKETPHSRKGLKYGYREQVKKMPLRVYNTEKDCFEVGHITNVIDSGKKDVFKVTLEKGYEVTLTSDHRVYTKDGWKPLGDAIGLDITQSGVATMSKDCYLATNGILSNSSNHIYRDKEWLSTARETYSTIQEIADEAGCSPHTIKKWLKQHGLQKAKFFEKGHSPWNKGKKGYKVNAKPFTEERLENIRKARSGSNSNFWRGGITSDRDSIGTWTSAQAPKIHKKYDYTCQNCKHRGGKLVAHHIIPVYADISLSKDLNNLITLCNPCHKHLHANNLEKEFAENMNIGWKPEYKAKKRAKKKYLSANFLKVLKIEKLGVQQVYDLSVDHADHNFIGNGVVLHNCSWNEASGRYIVFDAEFYMPDNWREQHESNKQGSKGSIEDQLVAHMLYQDTVRFSIERYYELIDMGVCKEQARMVLPLSLYTECYWTASLQSVMHFLALREDSHAQLEIQEYAKAVRELSTPHFPISLSL